MYTLHRLCRTCIQHSLPQIVIIRGPDGFGFTIFSDCPVRVQDVDSGGPAHSAGLRHGDVVLQLNAVSVETWGCGQLAHAIRSCPAHITLVIWRPAPETTPGAWPRPPLQQSETTKAPQTGPDHRRRGHTSLWRRSQDRGAELNANQPNRDEPPLGRNVLSGFGGEDYILLSPVEHGLSVGRATTIGRWYHPPPSSRSSYASATMPPPLAKTLGCYGDYENCTIVQSHVCTNDFGSRTLIFPIHLKVRRNQDWNRDQDWTGTRTGTGTRRKVECSDVLYLSICLLELHG